VNSRFINWIWEIRGSLALAPKQSSDEAFNRLDPFFRETGTTFERTNDTLIFRKKGQHAQDKMSVFDGGVLQIERGAGGPVLRYHLTSRALLFCFLAPLLFLGFAQLTIAVGNLEKTSADAAEKADEEKDPAEKYANIPLHPIDEFLGAPAPEKPKKDDKEKKEDDKKPSPTPAYVFAGIFATLYVVGRVLEDRLIKARFRKKLLGH
jgi:hypothetical protein